MASLPLPRLLPLSTRRLLHTHHRRLFHTTRALSIDDVRQPIVLEQPDAFRPPSHGARPRRKRSKFVYGKELTDHDREDLESRNYPYMMPSQSTTMGKFLRSKWIHVFIATSVLTACAVFVFVADFQKNNAYPHLLPHGSMFFRSPFRFLSEYYSVWRLNTEERDRALLEKRKQEAEDVARRREYRRAHDIPEVTGMAAWLGLGTVEEEERIKEKKAKEEQEMEAVNVTAVDKGDGVVVGREGEAEGVVERPKRKVFFGIWGW
ncbi:hypothetical protein BT63DRAFT_426508 [Microthyrium microscopicum]|uniref:Transmembrane protein n=1 Tax=Microthyrium microscopicum TaxID=703497 RepID=A0A6A6U7T2_9PEZI|nr:hypothetical protein BT63DRAFT_426508 [Microthyrium microscopicum]